MESVARRGFVLCSIYRANCLRRNKFSAATAERDRRFRPRKTRTSNIVRTTVVITLKTILTMRSRIAQSARSLRTDSWLSDDVFAEHTSSQTQHDKDMTPNLK